MSVIGWIFVNLTLSFRLLPLWTENTSCSMDVGFAQKLTLVKGIL